VISQHTVLAVDDEPANRRAVGRALAEDCRVLTAGSGPEALEVMARERVAMVISDQRMPGMSGAAFLAATVERYPAVIRIVLTGYTDVDTVLDAINRGHVYHFLGKPWQAVELRQVVRRGLERFTAEAERLQLLDDLRAACARAQREAEQKSRLLALTAHELGTPLHILLNVLALLRECELPAAPDWIGAGERAVEWLARGVLQMHDAARIGERRFPLRCEAVALEPLLTATVAEIRAAACDRVLDIAVDTGAPAAALHADRHWLRQALTALLSNAVRFTPDGGRVRVSARRDADWAEVTVTDTGIGIAGPQLAEAFEPFSSTGGDLLLHGSGRFAFGARGLGLGLAMVKGIAEAHGGTVRAESRLGVGSRFTLRVPVAAGTVPRSA
jgi:signal transduction histidine kinase